jgi:hypothetical protein
MFLTKLDDLGAIRGGRQSRFDAFKAIDRLVQAAFQAR